MTSTCDDSSHSGKPNLHQDHDHPLETRRPAQHHIPYCGMLERHSEFHVSAELVRPSGMRLLYFCLFAEEEISTEGQYFP